MKEADLYCPQRKCLVVSSPEEIVRQCLIERLTTKLQFPKAHILVEKELKELPHLFTKKNILPERRADILCYALKNNELQPLLLIECKSIPFGTKEILQLIGYNRYVKAPFIALVNQNTVQFGWYDVDLQDYKFIDYIPNFQELCDSIA